MPMPASVAGLPEPGQAIGHVEFRPYASGDEAGITRVLHRAHTAGWQGDAGHWMWKHAERPGFKPDEVTVAYVDGQMAACFHTATLPIRLEEGLIVPICIEGDFAVLPEFRGEGLPLPAHDRSSERLLAAGVILRGGFTSLELNERFYHRQFGYIFAPTVSADFKKILGLRPLQEKVAELGPRLLTPRARRALAGERLLVDLTIDQFPPCYLEITAEAIALHKGSAPSTPPPLRVRVPYRLLVAYRADAALWRTLVWNGLTGRLRFRGVFSNAGRLSRIFLKWIRS
jgi:hypothetical protein